MVVRFQAVIPHLGEVKVTRSQFGGLYREYAVVDFSTAWRQELSKLELRHHRPQNNNLGTLQVEA